mgnify:CR=1 FL=1
MRLLRIVSLMTPHDRYYALAGPGALSAFRRERLLRRLQAVDAGVTSVVARHVHFVHAARELSADESARLAALLDYGDAADAQESGERFLVVPRLGTISPWASKATDIARNTWLAAVRRV